MEKKGLAALVTILVVASLGIGYLSGNDTRATETMTSVSTSTETSTAISTSTETSVFAHGILVPTSSASTLDPLTGLSLNLNVSVVNGVQVFVTAYEFNTLGRVDNVTYGDSSLLNSSFFQWAKCDFATGGMVGYEVLEGDYGPDNYTSGAALWLELQPSAIGAEGCSDINLPVGEPVSSQDSHYAFSPLGGQNVLSGTYVGFWSIPADASTYQPFPPGVYTVVAADEWGQVAILHFIVAGG